ncbi:MAG: hypothetical protein ACTHK7_17170 [Aureliella sp.]
MKSTERALDWLAYLIAVALTLFILNLGLLRYLYQVERTVE